VRVSVRVRVTVRVRVRIRVRVALCFLVSLANDFHFLAFPLRVFTGVLVFESTFTVLFITRFFAGTYSAVTGATSSSTCSVCIAGTFV
jgi:hypothetical protein